jgi:hypothetical protein
MECRRLDEARACGLPRHPGRASVSGRSFGAVFRLAPGRTPTYSSRCPRRNSVRRSLEERHDK